MSKQSDDDQHRLLRIAPLLLLVVRQEVEMGDANRYDEMDAKGAIEARLDLTAETLRAARRVRDNEKPSIPVEGDCRRRGADTHVREYEGCDDAQADDDRAHDCEPDPSECGRIDNKRGDDRSHNKDRSD